LAYSTAISIVRWAIPVSSARYRDADPLQHRGVVGPVCGKGALGGNLDPLEHHRVNTPGEIDRGLLGHRDARLVGLDDLALAVGGRNEQEVSSVGVQHQDLLAIEHDAAIACLGLHLELPDRSR